MRALPIVLRLRVLVVFTVVVDVVFDWNRNLNSIRVLLYACTVYVFAHILPSYGSEVVQYV